MIRIWAKVMKKDKILSQYMFEKFSEMDYSEFFSYLKEICENLDIATPVLIKTHLFNFFFRCADYGWKLRISVSGIFAEQFDKLSF